MENYNFGEQIDKQKASIKSLPLNKVDRNLIIPKIIISYDEIYKILYEDLSQNLSLSSKEIKGLNEDYQKIQQLATENKQQSDEAKAQFKNLKTNSQLLINLIKEKLTCETKLKSLQEDRNFTKSNFDMEISTITNKLENELTQNNNFKESQIFEEKIINPREYMLNELKNTILEFSCDKQQDVKFPKEVTQYLHIESEKITENLQAESVIKLKSIMALLESKNIQYEENLKNFEESEMSRLNTSTEVNRSLEHLKKLDEIKSEREKEFTKEKTTYNNLQLKLKTDKENSKIEHKKELTSQIGQIVILILILIPLIIISF